MRRWPSLRRIALLIGIGGVAPVLLAAADRPAHGCTAVFVADGGQLLVGNNEDDIMPLTKVWVVPGGAGKYGRLYVGFANYTTPQGAVNEKGLWFDSFSADPEPVAGAPGEKAFDGDLHDKFMAECATVEEVVALLRQYQRPFLVDNMLMVGDRTGASAIIEGNAVLQRQGPYQILTNFRQSEQPNGSAVCDRYRIAESMLRAHPSVNVDRMRRILSAVHQEAGVATVYSYIYDFRTGLLYLYHFHDYDSVVVLDVPKELAKGAHSYSLPELFPASFAAEDFASRSAAALEVRKAAARYPQFDPKTYPQFAGRYVVSSPAPAGLAGISVVITAGTDRLRADLSDGNIRELIPASPTAFSVWEPGNKGTVITFLRDSFGKVTGFTAALAAGEQLAATRAE